MKILLTYFYKDDNSIDFDIYQWAKGEELTLESEANHFATEYSTTAEAVTDLRGIEFSRELRARSGSALTVHRTVIHSRTRSIPSIS